MTDDTDNKDTTFQMRVASSFLAKVDDWRVKLRPVPSRSEAVRMLVEFAMKHWKEKR
jgi:hypothetical protein